MPLKDQSRPSFLAPSKKLKMLRSFAPAVLLKSTVLAPSRSYKIFSFFDLQTLRWPPAGRGGLLVLAHEAPADQQEEGGRETPAECCWNGYTHGSRHLLLLLFRLCFTLHVLLRLIFLSVSLFLLPSALRPHLQRREWKERIRKRRKGCNVAGSQESRVLMNSRKKRKLSSN